MDFFPLWLSLKLAGVTTCLLLVLGIPLAYWLAFSPRRGKFFVEALVSLPLVLPPTVLGFYLLVALGPRSWFGGMLENVFDVRLVFSFSGLVIGSVVFSLPFMVNPLKAAFENLSPGLREASYTLGKSEGETLLKILLPNIRPGLLTAVIMSFAHTLGEFGVVLMIGGNIPEQTRVASIAIFSQVEALNYPAAHAYSLILVAMSFSILLALHVVHKRSLPSGTVL